MRLPKPPSANDAPPRPAVRSADFWPLIICCALALLAVAALIAHTPGPAPGPHGAAPVRTAVAPPPGVPVPAVEPLVILDMTPDTAREINAKVPFVTTPNPPARPFLFAGSPIERERARTCLAAAVWFEAGNDKVGQQAVAQVVLNRMRHPAYPKSVCGVVFQGSERKTGCQFTFTCDGAIQRTPPPALWREARKVADAALNGFVFRQVGTATHYHTDWVVPYWGPTLDKITAVHTHLFFRWRGWFGTPAAFTRRYEGPERLDPRLAYLAEGDAALPQPGDPLAPSLDPALPDPLGQTPGERPSGRPALSIDGISKADLRQAIVRLADPANNEYGLELDATVFPGSYAIVALAICKGKPGCTVLGWSNPARIPAALPVPPAILRTVTFLYRRNAATGHEDVFWNCRQIPRAITTQCLPGTQPDPAPPPARSPAVAPPSAPGAPSTPAG